VNELIGHELPEGDWDTVGGFLYHLLGHVPEEGEAADFDGHRLVAQKVDGRRIARVLIGVSVPEGAAGAAGAAEAQIPVPDGAEEQP
jgi:magnesium and cobalt exporter, CNNM family